MKNLLAILAFTLFAHTAQAEMIETDYLTTGDAQATLDTQTGLEWLDLTHTYNTAYNNIQSELQTTFSGWRLPTIAEIDTYFAHWFPGITIGAGNQGFDPSLTNQFVDFMGDRGDGYAAAFNMNDTGTLKLWQISPAGGVWNNYHSYNQYLGGHSGVGIFLVSDGGTTLSSQLDPTLNINNPEAPINNSVADVASPLMLSGLALFLMAAGRRKRQH